MLRPVRAAEVPPASDDPREERTPRPEPAADERAVDGHEVIEALRRGKTGGVAERWPRHPWEPI